MPDEIPKLLDAWARQQVSPSRMPVLGRSPSPAFLGAVRRARLVRAAGKFAGGAAAIVLIVLLVIWLLPQRESPAAPNPAAPPRAMDR